MFVEIGFWFIDLYINSCLYHDFHDILKDSFFFVMLHIHLDQQMTLEPKGHCVQVNLNLFWSLFNGQMSICATHQQRPSYWKRRQSWLRALGMLGRWRTCGGGGGPTAVTSRSTWSLENRTGPTRSHTEKEIWVSAIAKDLFEHKIKLKHLCFFFCCFFFCSP